jgi:hypothetical protein
MNRKDRKRRDWLGKRIAELATGPRTDEAMAELREHAAELESMRAVPAPVPELSPPGAGTFTPKRARPETEEDRWRRVISMRSGTGAAAVIYAPERAR